MAARRHCHGRFRGHLYWSGLPRRRQNRGMEPVDTLYLQIAQTLAASIRGGVLARGERLPSLRDLAAQHGVSLSTAVQAYRALEDMRLVQTRPRSGFFVAARPPRPPVPETTRPPAGSREVDIDAQAAHAMRYAHEEGYITFGAAAPSDELFSVERIRRTVMRAAQRHRAVLCEYVLGSGNETLRRAIARYALRLGCQLRPRDIVATNSCLESMQDVVRRVAVLIEQTATCFAAVHYVFRGRPFSRVSAPGAFLGSVPRGYPLAIAVLLDHAAEQRHRGHYPHTATVIAIVFFRAIFASHRADLQVFQEHPPVRAQQFRHESAVDFLAVADHLVAQIGFPFVQMVVAFFPRDQRQEGDIISRDAAVLPRAIQAQQAPWFTPFAYVAQIDSNRRLVRFRPGCQCVQRDAQVLILDRLQVVQFRELPQHGGAQEQLAVVAPLILPIGDAQPFSSNRHPRSTATAGPSRLVRSGRATVTRRRHRSRLPTFSQITEALRTVPSPGSGRWKITGSSSHTGWRPSLPTRMRTLERASLRRSLRRGLVHASGSTGSNCRRRSAPCTPSTARPCWYRTVTLPVSSHG